MFSKVSFLWLVGIPTSPDSVQPSAHGMLFCLGFVYTVFTIQLKTQGNPYAYFWHISGVLSFYRFFFSTLLHKWLPYLSPDLNFLHPAALCLDSTRLSCSWKSVPRQKANVNVELISSVSLLPRITVMYCLLSGAWNCYFKLLLRYYSCLCPCIH